MLYSWFRLLYTVWCVLVFAVLFLLLVPFVLLGSWLVGKTDRFGLQLAHGAIRLWGILAFVFMAIPIRVEWRFRPTPGQAYVYCANHFSYFDIAVLGVMVPGLYAFIGKKSVRKLPLFGYMYARLHILVDRSNARSRASSLSRCIQTLAQGRSIIIFPEGGIQAENPPRMCPFKEGAFTMAIQQQVPLVPLTLLNNYRILPDNGPFRVHWQPVRVVVHKPIPTTGLTQADAAALRERTYRIIDHELQTTGNVLVNS